MAAKKIKFLIRLALCLGIFVLLMPLSMGTVQAVNAAHEKTAACMRCPGGGGGGGGGGQLTAVEVEGLVYMREEEKLARDAYLTLYDRWHLSIFANISNSEFMHMSRIKTLLDNYGIADPAAGKGIGQFTNPILQQLYNDLMIRGSQSSTEALRVGVTIEQVDIRDLQKYLGLTNRSDIINVYSNLLNGSNCHLRAFNNQLGQ